MSTGRITKPFWGISLHCKSFFLRHGEKSAQIGDARDIQQHGLRITRSFSERAKLSSDSDKINRFAAASGTEGDISSILSDINASQQLKTSDEQNIKIDKTE